MMQWLVAAALTCTVAGTAGTPWVHHNEPPSDYVSTEPEERRLELQIRPAHATAPAAIRVTALVNRHAENRALTLGVECPIYRRRSTIQLDGADAARSHSIIYESLPACSYEITARLRRTDGSDVVEVLVAEVTR